MRIVIIEDEKITADDLALTITTLEPEARIEAILSSVKTAVTWFQNNPFPDLIFCDVQLGDGLSFEIFKAVKVDSPIVFCTAYDEYALNAFRTNGIDYILKPSTADTIGGALAKYRGLKQTLAGSDQQYKAIIEALLNRKETSSVAVLVNYKDKIIPINLENVALFYLENEITYLVAFSKTIYSISKNLEELEQLCGNNFFRANRQCLINRKAVIDASRYFSRKLSVNISVPFKEKITISKEKTPQFLSWLEHIS